MKKRIFFGPFKILPLKKGDAPHCPSHMPRHICPCCTHTCRSYLSVWRPSEADWGSDRAEPAEPRQARPDEGEVGAAGKKRGKAPLPGGLPDGDYCWWLLDFGGPPRPAPPEALVPPKRARPANLAGQSSVYPPAPSPPSFFRGQCLPHPLIPFPALSRPRLKTPQRSHFKPSTAMSA